MTYTTIQGDTWDIIAFKVYGSEYVMDQLMEANLQLIDTVIFGAGIIIFTPEIDAVTTPESLPPWMR